MIRDWPPGSIPHGNGGTGLPFTEGPDTRIPNATSLPPGPFQLAGPNLAFDAYAGDTVHQYFQMVQQVDCAIDAEQVSKDNPTGCLHDLQSAIDTTYATPPGGTRMTPDRPWSFSTCRTATRLFLSPSLTATR